MDSLAHYHSFLRQFIGFIYPLDILNYIIQLMYLMIIPQIFCNRNHTFVIRGQSVHYYGLKNDNNDFEKDPIIIDLVKFDSFYCGNTDASIILPDKNKVVYFATFEYYDITEIFVNQELINSHENYKCDTKIICTMPKGKKIIKIFHSSTQLFMLENDEITIYGLQIAYYETYPQFELVSDKNNVKLYRYSFHEKIKKIISVYKSIFILSVTGNIYEWPEYDPSKEKQLNSEPFIDINTHNNIPLFALKSDGTGWILKYMNDPIMLDISEPIKEIYCASFRARFLTISGKLCFYWKLLDGHKLEPDEYIDILCDSISYGEKHFFLIGKNGKIYVMGNNDYGQLGIGKTEYIQFPRLINLK